MITHIRLLQSVGKFDFVPAGAFALDQNVLIYAENGRGKTTLTAILRSLSTGDPLLYHVWTGIDRTRTTALMLERDGEGSNIVAWDVHDELVSDHDRNHALVTEYLRNGPRQNSREVAKALRPILEAFLRVAYPEHFMPDPQSMRRFRNICRANLGTNAEILSRQELQELESLVDYANLFHHNTNPGFRDIVVQDGELQGFAQRTLRFATRKPI